MECRNNEEEVCTAVCRRIQSILLNLALRFVRAVFWVTCEVMQASYPLIRDTDDEEEDKPS